MTGEPEWNRRPCVITGAGRGLGRSLARQLAAAGTTLAICARTAPEIDDARTELIELGSPSVLGRALDITDPVAGRAFADDVLESLGPTVALVNNAATLGPVGPIDEIDLEAWRAALVTNVFGIANMAAAFVPQMTRAGGGRIINLSGGGIGGPTLSPRISAYASSKASVAVLTEVLALELRSVAITVNAVAPGAQPTAMIDELLHAGPDLAGAALFEQTQRQQAAPASLDPFVELVQFLLAEESGWLSGKLLSARWDSVDTLRSRRTQLDGSSLLNLRRIDDALYQEVVSSAENAP